MHRNFTIVNHGLVLVSCLYQNDENGAFFEVYKRQRRENEFAIQHDGIVNKSSSGLLPILLFLEHLVSW